MTEASPTALGGLPLQPARGRRRRRDGDDEADAEQQDQEEAEHGGGSRPTAAITPVDHPLWIIPTAAGS